MPEFDLAKAIQHLQVKAKPGNARKGQCAKYVNDAIKAGHINIGFVKPRSPPFPSACDYGPYLQAAGFELYLDTHDGGGISYKAQAGDIVIFDPYKGQHPHEHGHIQMFDGTRWISDFKQLDFFPGGDARVSLPPFRAFRFSGLVCRIANYAPAPLLK